ncbi:MAG TPA: hypothetical protein PKA41_16405 [Verrucomicrobiota bacterium]|nr:hypothetical protein [Verrucomicrobiota bacterium]
MNILKPFAFLTTALLLTVAVGCRDAKDSHGHTHDGKSGHSHDARHGHDHAPPHGGTPVIIADDQFHLELVLDASAAKMQAYVLDGHLEGYIQVAETSFVIAAKLGEQTEELSFQRVSANNSGKSSLFEAQADWLKAAKEFDGYIPTITLDGKTFTNISFTFPKGTKHVH